MQCTAAEKHSRIGFGDSEVAHVLANLRKRALEKGAVAGERVY
jgi:hypothetical protein